MGSKFNIAVKNFPKLLNAEKLCGITKEAVLQGEENFPLVNDGHLNQSCFFTLKHIHYKIKGGT